MGNSTNQQEEENLRVLEKDEEDCWSSIGRLSRIHGFEAEWYSVPSKKSQLLFRKRLGESRMEERLEMFGRR